MYGLQPLYDELLKRSIVFRYAPDQLASLQARGLGLGFNPPTRSTETRYGPATEEVIPTSFEPVLISSAQWESCQRLCAAWELFFRYAFEVFTDPERRAALNGKYGLIGTLTERTHSADCSGYRSLIPFGRYDCVIRPDGTFAVMDVNSSRPIGAGHMYALTGMFTERKLTDAIPISTIDPLIQVITRCYREWCVTNGREVIDPPPLTIVVPESHGSHPDFQVLAKQLRKTKAFAAVQLLDPEDLRHDAAADRIFGQVEGHEEELPLILRTVKPDIHPGIAPVLLEGYPTAACVVGPLWRRWLGNKLWMALAQFEPMRSEIAAALGSLASDFFRSLPRTGLYQSGRVLFADGPIRLESLASKAWVAKVPAGSSARGVLIGQSMSPAAWFEGVAGFSDSTVIIQEFIEPSVETLTIPDGNGGACRGPFKTKHGLFTFGGVAAGIEVHACTDSLRIHGGRGTIAVPAFVRR